jgi:hypothetical protein
MAPSTHARPPKGTATGGCGSHARHCTARGGLDTWAEHCGIAMPRRSLPPPVHCPPLNRLLPHSESPPFPSSPSITYLALRKPSPRYVYAFAEVSVDGMLLERLACPRRDADADTLRRNTSRAQQCRRCAMATLQRANSSPRRNR